MKRFLDLRESEVLALAISLEEEDERVYADFADGLRQSFPATAAVFEAMGREESAHRQRLTELFKQGQYVPIPVEKQIVLLYAAANGFIDTYPESSLKKYESELSRFLDSKGGAALKEIEEKKAIDASIEEKLQKLLSEFRDGFTY